MKTFIYGSLNGEKEDEDEDEEEEEEEVVVERK